MFLKTRRYYLYYIVYIVYNFSFQKEQRPEEQIVSPRGLPEVQQGEPGGPAGGPHTGAGGEARRGGKVRQPPPGGK